MAREWYLHGSIFFFEPPHWLDQSDTNSCACFDAVIIPLPVSGLYLSCMYCTLSTIPNCETTARFCPGGPKPGAVMLYLLVFLPPALMVCGA
jgi:hypothetical protein